MTRVIEVANKSSEKVKLTISRRYFDCDLTPITSALQPSIGLQP
ncbi:hypothetical protein [Lysinibacillus agricola]